MYTQPTDLFTDSQKSYVDGIPDSELRSHLLHQVRLRDNMESDRNLFEKMLSEWPSIPKSMQTLRNELLKDDSEGSYYFGWQSNIAMSFFDQFMNDHEGLLTQRQLSEVANKAAKRFLHIITIQSSTNKHSII